MALFSSGAKFEFTLSTSAVERCNVHLDYHRDAAVKSRCKSQVDENKSRALEK